LEEFTVRKETEYQLTPDDLAVVMENCSGELKSIYTLLNNLTMQVFSYEPPDFDGPFDANTTFASLVENLEPCFDIVANHIKRISHDLHNVADRYSQEHKDKGENSNE